ncbi:MAG TPA: exodeoxyribonuclease V subunit gamma, partial [Kofleriaceae bacterium]|nr:exodeoxyribonuclease V subunit gamma [Kofleriaceae bacterium]
MAAWLELRMAARAGIAANLRMPFLDSYLAARARARAAAGAPERILDRSALEALLCTVLDDPEVLAAADLAPVRAYLGPPVRPERSDREAVAESKDDLRRFQLAREVAGLFTDYTLARPELTAAWPERALLDGSAFSAAEAWQRRLWLAVFGSEGVLARDPDTRWLPAPAYLEAVPAAELELARPLHLFGFSGLAPSWYRMFERLSAATELHLYALNPCREFWEDTAGRRAGAGEQPALQLWGRAGREQVRRLGALAGLVERDRDRWIDPGAASALARLQQDMLQRRDDTAAAAAPRPPLDTDDSVRLLACPGVRRELEVIAGEIVRLLRADATLRLDQIAVLFPRGDAERYQAQVSAVFGELGDLPHHLLDAPLAGPGRVLEAFELLLDLPFGRFTRPELLRLLTHPAVTARFPDIDPGDWVRWAVRLGIVHGADGDDHRGTYIEENVFHWDQGIRRLALGAVMAGEGSGAARPFTIGGRTWLPEEVGQDALASAGRFALLARSLIADARHLRGLRLPLAQWATLLDLLATTYLVPATDEDERQLGRCRQAAGTLRERDLDGRPVAYRIACEMVRAEIADVRGPRGEPLAGGILVAPLAHARALPFRVLFVAGLGEGRFPAAEHDSPLDLRNALPGAADVTPRERDRWLFLETVLAARERLYLSWVARDEQSGEELEPSSVVLELERMVRAELAPAAAEALRVRHPLRRFEPPAAGDALGARQAQALALRRQLEDHFRSRGQSPPG